MKFTEVQRGTSDILSLTTGLMSSGGVSIPEMGRGGSDQRKYNVGVISEWHHRG